MPRLTRASCHRPCVLLFAEVAICRIFLSLMQRQLAFILARAQVPLEWVRSPGSANTMESFTSPEPESERPEDLVACLSNTNLSEHFRAFGKELAVEEPKSLEDIYKSHLEHTRE